MTVSGDFLIIGSGVAGLRAALGLVDAGRVVVLTKADPQESNTGYAQGGIAVALGEDDSPALHARDTVAAGDQLCDPDAVEVLVEDGRRYVEQLVEWGARFDRDDQGRLALGREAAHSVRRVLHARDATGREIGRVLWERVAADPRIHVLEDAQAVALLTHEGACIGASFVTREGRLQRAEAARTLLATGGAGQVFRETTNPPVATGDGIAMAFDAGARVADLEFVQFHPTVLQVANAPRFLLSEALRGEGGVLLNDAGERFVSRYEPAGDLASRDLVARAIVREMERTAGMVYLSMTHVDATYVRRRFPTIAAACAKVGLDLATDRIPISPAAHYMMGGVQTDLDARTSVSGLFAAGEVACTGVHGANRLASNSLLEGLVFGARAAEAMRQPAVVVEWAAASEQLSMRQVTRPGPAEAGPHNPTGLAEAGPHNPTGSAEAGPHNPTGPAEAGPHNPTGSTEAGPHNPAGSAEAGPHTHAVTGGPASVAAVRNLMWRKVGIVRSQEGLREAVDRLNDWRCAMSARTVDDGDVEPLRLARLITVGLLIAHAALRREESRGGHFRSDFPTHDDARWKRHVADVREDV